jgi:hypothetical protein
VVDTITNTVAFNTDVLGSGDMASNPKNILLCSAAGACVRCLTRFPDITGVRHGSRSEHHLHKR